MTTRALTSFLRSDPPPAPREVEALRGAWRPARPRLAEARAAVAGGGPRAWESLVSAGLLPPGWIGDARRAFARDRSRGVVRGVLAGGPDGDGVCRVGLAAGGETFAPALALEPRVAVGDEVIGDPMAITATWIREGAVHMQAVFRACGRPSPWFHAAREAVPSSAELPAALAADPDGAAQAEAFVDEAASRLAPWGLPAPARVVWSLAPHLPGPGIVGPICAVFDAMGLAPGPDGADAVLPHHMALLPHCLARRSCDPTLVHHMQIAVGFRRWEDLARSGARVPPPREGRSAPNRARFSELPNPFLPLAEVCALGYLPVFFRGSSSAWVFTPGLL